MSDRPDALILPESIKEGPDFRRRVASVTDAAEPFLRPDHAAGEQCHIHRQHGGVVFITRDPHDELRYGGGHPKAGQDRYRWEDKGRGVRVGYLLEPPAPPPAEPEVSLREYLEALARDT